MPPLTRRAAWFALGVIFSANFLSYLDRTLVSALEGPLSTDFELKSKQFGLLWTLFTVGYMVCAIPIGYLADRYNRPRILALCIVIWSMATVGSGLASAWSPEALYACRFFIGVGEAGCLIIGQALIADYFASEVRGKALSLFHAAVPLGGTGAFILAGILESSLGWRPLFLVAGFPGLLLAILILMLTDPPRGGATTHPGTLAPGGSKSDIWEYLDLFKIRTLMFVIIGQAFAVILLVCWIHFGVQFFVKVRGMDPERARITLGVLALVSGALGNSIGGVLGDRLARKHKGGYTILAGIGYLAATPLLIVGFLSPEKWIYLPTLTAGSFCLFMCMPALNAQIAAVTPAHQRAMAWSLAVFILHMMGDTAAPWVFGIVDAAYGRTNAFTGFTFFLVLAGLSCLIASRFATREVDRLVSRPPEGPPPGPV